MKKITAVILAVILMLSLCVPVLATDKETFNYVSLGASNTNGYGLHGYLNEYYYEHPDQLDDTGPGASGYKNIPDDCYPNYIYNVLLSRGYNAKLFQMAQSSMRVEELRFLLDENYTADEYTKWRFYDDETWSYPVGWWGKNLAELRAEYKEAITNADLITFDLGLNNFGVYLSNQLQSHLYGNDLSRLLGEEEAAKFYELRAKIGEATASLIDPAVQDKLNSLLDTITYALLGFIENFDASMKIIREWNDDADIVVLSIQNVMAGLDISYDGILIPFGEIFGVLAKQANLYISGLSPYVNEYLYADPNGSNGRVTYFFDEIQEYNGDPTTLSGDMIDCLNVYDRKLHVKTRVQEAVNAIGGTFDNEEARAAFENEVLLKAYNAAAVQLQAASKINPLPIDGLISGEADLGKAGDAVMDGFKANIDAAIKNAIDQRADPTVETFDIYAATDELLSDDANRVVAGFGLRTSIGNSFFAHPNVEGCRQCASAVLYAWDNEVNGREALAKALFNAKADLVKYATQYGTRFTVALIDKFGTAMGMEAGTIQGIVDKLPTDAATDLLAQYLMFKLGITSIDDTEALNHYMEEIVASIQAEPVHVHTAKYHASVGATCTKAGSRGYFSCDCGKMFSDKACTEEITAESIVIPATGHKLTRIAARSATLFTTGNKEYYVCAKCGQLFADKNGTTPTNLLAVTVPKVSVARTILSLFRK